MNIQNYILHSKSIIQHLKAEQHFDALYSIGSQGKCNRSPIKKFRFSIFSTYLGRIAIAIHQLRENFKLTNELFYL